MMGPLPYIGGKRRLAREIISLFPEHTTYVEPFAGGAQVLFRKPPSRSEILNDIDDEVINYLLVLQRHPAELSRVLRWLTASRRLFERYRVQQPAPLTDVERAARFFYLQKNTWSGLRARRRFHYRVTLPSNYRPSRLPQSLVRLAERLDRVQIEHLPYEDILRRYDRPTTFFYCDPPYVGVRHYQHNFSDPQFERLAAALGKLDGLFLLSINDCAKARLWFRHFHSRPISVTYTSMRKPRKFQELLFANYPLEPSDP